MTRVHSRMLGSASTSLLDTAIFGASFACTVDVRVVQQWENNFEPYEVDMRLRDYVTACALITSVASCVALIGCDGDDNQTSDGGSGGASSSSSSSGGGSGGSGGEGGAGGSSAITIPDVITLEGAAWPEDVAISGTKIFVSNFVTGGIQVFDLQNPAASAKALVQGPSSGALKSFWGMEPTADGKLYAIVNINYAFNGMISEPGEVRVYDQSTGMLEKTWKLPANTVGNAIDTDDAGNIYVGDIGPSGKIYKIDPKTDMVTTWKEDAVNWDTSANGFGHGGMTYSPNGVYTVIQGALWRVPVQADGSAGAVEKVAVTGPDGMPVMQVRADGLRWAGNDTIVYAQNDAFAAGANGIVYTLKLSNPTTGTLSVLADKLKDCSGIGLGSFDGKDYAFIAESQFGHLFMVDPGEPTLPFRVVVKPR